MKVNFFDRSIISQFYKDLSIVSTIITVIFTFVQIQESVRYSIFTLIMLACIFHYIFLWRKAKSLSIIKLPIDNSTVVIKGGDIFEEQGFKAIAFNEYFDTRVDEHLISSKTLNGIFINKFFPSNVEKLDNYINQYHFNKDDIIEDITFERSGKNRRFKPGTVCVYKDFLLVAFSKFTENNMATLTMPEYLEFLVTFWNRVNQVYSQKNVTVPIFGSGITRITGHKSISDEDLLKAMLWTFKLSEMRFKHPSQLTIIIHKEKLKNINLLSIKNAIS